MSTLIHVFFIVATKDRPDDLRRMLESLNAQTRRPDGVIVVDASGEPVRNVVDEFPELNPRFIRAERPSASGQRNAGIRALPDDVSLVGFLDDDVVLEPDAVEKVLEFWREAPEDLGGVHMNHLNHPPMQLGVLKRSWLCRLLGLYSPEPGRVMPSGWQTLTGTVERTIYVEWLPSTAAVWRRSVIEAHQFEEFFDGYSYLEDLDFSYGVRKSGYKLAVVADAGFYHYQPGRAKDFDYFHFGRIEVRNRLFFVRKHDLSILRFGIAAVAKISLTLCSPDIFQKKYRRRVAGNIVQLAFSCLGRGEKT